MLVKRSCHGCAVGATDGVGIAPLEEHYACVDEPPGRFPDPTICHVCGSTTFEYVDDSHIRCVECGHGATVSRLVAVANAEQKPSPVAVSEFEERMRTYEEEAAAVFRGAPFRPYALDGRWSGPRSFGGHAASDGRTTSLTLAFSEGHPWDTTLPEVHVETRVGSMEGADRNVAAKADAFIFAQQQVHHLWSHTGVLRDDVRRYAFPREERAPTTQPQLGSGRS